MNLYSDYESKLGALRPCVTCSCLGESCFGANMSARPFSEVIAWCLARKKVLNISNQTIADRSGVSIHTINKLFTGNLESCNRETIMRLVMALVNPPEGAAFCVCPFLDENGQINHNKAVVEKLELQIGTLLAENHHLKQQLEAADERAERRVTRALEDKRRSIDHLKEQIAEQRTHAAQREKTIRVLSTLLGIAVAALIAMLLADLLVPGMGWLRY